MGRKKSRGLWTKIKARIPGGIDRGAFWGTLRASINRGDYELPEGWDVQIQWRNREDAPMRSQDFTLAMQESAESSRGWDLAIVGYVDRQIARLDAPTGTPQKAAALTRELYVVVKSYKRRAPGRKRRTVTVKGYRYERRRA